MTVWKTKAESKQKLYAYEELTPNHRLIAIFTYGPPADKTDLMTKSENLKAMHKFKNSVHVEPFLKISNNYHER